MSVRTVDWNARTSGYVDEMANAYHAQRTQVMTSMIPDWALKPGVTVFDFGCGDGFLMPYFMQAGATATGCDIAAGMIDSAREKLSGMGLEIAEDTLAVGGVEQFESIRDGSLDGVVALNVLAYLNPEEETAFYEQAARTIRPGGFLLVSHSNRLFDMYSLNAYTVRFFRDYLIADDSYADGLESLISRHDLPSGAKSDPLPVRENPLNYGLKLDKYGFEETRQEFSNRHEAPPPILGVSKSETSLAAPPEERWKFMFTCSTFASLAARR